MIDPRLATAIHEGAAARKQVEDAARTSATEQADTKAKAEREHRARLKKTWVDDGKIFSLILDVAATGGDSVNIADGGAALAGVLNAVPGLKAEHQTFRYRPSDDHGEIDGESIKVTWKTP